MRRRRRNREPDAPAGRVSDVSVPVTASEPTERGGTPPEMEGITRPDFPAFYRDAYPAVARALGVTLGDRELGAEAADEAMARCYSHWSTVRSYDNPAGWVYRVGLNWARSLRRRMSRRPPPHHLTVVEQPNVADPQIQQALAELDIRLRAVVVCRFLLDWSTQETADALNLRPGTVKSRLHRALGQLENKLHHFKEEG